MGLVGMNSGSWSIQKIWNDSLDARRKERPLVDRTDKIWASEIGGAMIDRYLKMKGTPPTNPPNARSQRKFEAGNLWENIVGHVLARAGILIQSQEWLKFQYPGLLPVTGKLDFMAGGNPDYDKASNAVQEFNWLPEFITTATLNIVNNLKEQYPNGLKNIILEIKSCSSFMYEVYEKKGTASPQHKCQAFHYLKAKNMDEAHIVYVSRDDARILEVGVMNPSLVEDDYFNDIKKITEHIKTSTRPEIEKPLVFDSTLGKFSANWKCGYSQYLTMLYGLENQMAFDNTYKPIAERFNRVLGRIEEGKELTDNNQKALEEMQKWGFDVEKIKETVKKEA